MNDIKQPKKAKNSTRRAPAPKTIIGWREKVDLPDLGLFGMVAKIDTGARTSALHVDKIETFVGDDGAQWAEISIKQALPGGGTTVMSRRIPISDKRIVKSSNNIKETRVVIKTTLVLAASQRLVEFTLTNRKSMRYPILIGRSAMKRGLLINPGKSFLLTSQALVKESTNGIQQETNL